MIAIQQLIDAVASRTRAASWRWEIEPAELAKSEFTDALDKMVASADAADRPKLHRFFADNYALIVADLGSDWRSGREAWLLAQTEVALLRSSLSPGRNEDLMLMLVASPGTDRQPEWIALAAEIERNDRVCRKLVWLPPAAPNKTTESIQSFLGRSFLARPWLDMALKSLPALDAAKNPSLLLGDWETILDQHLLHEPDYITLVRALVEKESK